MKNSFIQFVLCLVALFYCPSISLSQWMRTSGPYGGAISSLMAYGRNLYAGTWSGVFVSTDSGGSWSAMGLKNDWVSALAAYSDDVVDTILFAGTFYDNGAVFHSTDNGKTWIKSDSGMKNIPINCLAVKDSTILAGTYLWGLYRSTNNAMSWNANDSGISTNSVHAFLISGGNIFAGADGGVFVSTDNGASWNAPKSGTTNFVAYTLAISNMKLFAGSDKGEVYLSSDSGRSWIEINAGFTQYDINAMTVSGKYLFAGTSGGGVFLSTNDAVTWIPINGGLTNQNILSLTVCDSILFAGTDLTVWKLPLSEVPTGIEQNPGLLPSNFTLSQNYPNPFNPATTINYAMPQKSLVRIEVFNVLGERVTTLVNDLEQAGRHSVKFDGTALPSGVYFCRLSTANHVSTMKMTLLK